MERRYPRIARVNEVVREVVADEIERLSDPRLGFVTVTGVDVAPDLKTAKVYYSALDADADAGDDDLDSRQALESARAHLQAALGRQVRLKYLPRLVFVEDPSVATALRIDEIISELHEEEP